MVSSSTECQSSDGAARVTREAARARAVAALTQAERVAVSMSPGTSEFDATRIRAHIDIASEWRYLAEEL